MRLSSFLYSLVRPFQSKRLTSYDDIDKWLKRYKIENYTIANDLSVSVAGDVIVSHQHLQALPFKFNAICGDFDISHNELTTLYNSPNIVEGHFNCSYNQITCLQGGPHTVGMTFNVSHNPLRSLEYGPVLIGDFCEHTHQATMNGIDCSSTPYILLQREENEKKGQNEEALKNTDFSQDTHFDNSYSSLRADIKNTENSKTTAPPQKHFTRKLH